MFLWLSVSHRLSAAKLQLEARTYEAASMPPRVDLLACKDKEEVSWFSFKTQNKETLKCFILHHKTLTNDGC